MENGLAQMPRVGDGRGNFHTRRVYVRIVDEYTDVYEANIRPYTRRVYGRIVDEYIKAGCGDSPAPRIYIYNV
jgi:hypothetical protein